MNGKICSFANDVRLFNLALWVGLPNIFKKNRGHHLSISFIHFLDDLEHYKSFFIFEKLKKNTGQFSEKLSRWSA